MYRTKFKYENKQRAITKKLSKQELRFMGTALPLDEIYPPASDPIIRPVFDGCVRR